jgi:indolepyruvate ferredoxin oxidoreductase alpha subunit
MAGDQPRIEWAVNEKSAFDIAFGASLAGMRTLLCLKSVGLNVALDSLMVSNLAAGDGAFVILVGDDPGGWGSQNEEDSRLLVAAAEIPLLEPSSLTDAGTLMCHAFDLSEQFNVPVAVRITRALTAERIVDTLSPPTRRIPRKAAFQREPDRFNVLPIHVVHMHQRLQSTTKKVRALFEQSLQNGVLVRGSRGVIAAGFAQHKLKAVLEQSSDPPLSILHLSTLNPLPEGQIVEFLHNLDAVLVLEETAPFVETQVQAIAQRAGLC